MAKRPRKKNPARQIQPEIGPEKAFGQALREIRAGKEISQEQLALETGIDRTYISLIERGINSPTIRTVVKLARVLKVAPSKIVVRMEQYLADRRINSPTSKVTYQMGIWTTSGTQLCRSRFVPWTYEAGECIRSSTTSTTYARGIHAPLAGSCRKCPIMKQKLRIRPRRRTTVQEFLTGIFEKRSSAS